MREQEQTIEVTEGFSIGQPQLPESQKSDWQKLINDPCDVTMSAFAVAAQFFAGIVFFIGLVAFVAVIALFIAAILATRGG